MLWEYVCGWKQMPEEVYVSVVDKFKWIGCGIKYQLRELVYLISMSAEHSLARFEYLTVKVGEDNNMGFGE